MGKRFAWQRGYGKSTLDAVARYIRDQEAITEDELRAGIALDQPKCDVGHRWVYEFSTPQN